MKKVFLTGGARGIGKAIAEKFATEGYEIIAPKRDELDLMSNESIENYIQLHQAEMFDVIINNAGCNDINIVEEITDNELNQMMQVNLIAPIKLLRGLIPGMKRNPSGRIVNISSIWASVSKEGRCVYSATKHGVHGITNTLAVELAKDNILVNSVSPGFTLTELTKKNNTSEQIKVIETQIPMNRMAEPYEIAEVVYFLGSESNTYVTGQNIVVDGGFTVR